MKYADTANKPLGGDGASKCQDIPLTLLNKPSTFQQNFNKSLADIQSFEAPFQLDNQTAWV